MAIIICIALVLTVSFILLFWKKNFKGWDKNNVKEINLCPRNEDCYILPDVISLALQCHMLNLQIAIDSQKLT